MPQGRGVGDRHLLRVVVRMNGGTSQAEVDHVHSVLHCRVDGRDDCGSRSGRVPSGCAEHLVISQKSPGRDSDEGGQRGLHSPTRGDPGHPGPVSDLVSRRLIELRVETEFSLYKGPGHDHFVVGKPLGLRDGKPLGCRQVGILKHDVILVDPGVNQSDPDPQARHFSPPDFLPGLGRSYQLGSRIHQQTSLAIRIDPTDPGVAAELEHFFRPGPHDQTVEEKCLLMQDFHVRRAGLTKGVQKSSLTRFNGAHVPARFGAAQGSSRLPGCPPGMIPHDTLRHGRLPKHNDVGGPPLHHRTRLVSARCLG